MKCSIFKPVKITSYEEYVNKILKEATRIIHASSEPKKRRAPEKRRVAFSEYMQDLVKEATRIIKDGNGGCSYSSAQLEIALFSFCDFKTIKNEMDPNIEVDFSSVPLEYDWIAGFDWLDLAVSHNDPDAINYFQENLKNNYYFKMEYDLYKEQYRPDCVLRNYEEPAGPTLMKYGVM